MSDSPRVVLARDGAEVALWRHEPAVRRHDVPVLLVHGTFSNRFFFGGQRGLAAYLADRGFDAWVAELRGRRPEPVAGEWDFEDWILGDAPALVNAVLGATGVARLAWVGHSAGAVIGTGFAARAPEQASRLAALVMLAAPAPHAPGAAHVATAALGHAVSAGAGRFPARALRIGPVDERPGILRRWFSWNRGGRWVGRDGFDYHAAALAVAVPALALAGAADLLAPPSACRRLLDLTRGERELITCGRANGFSRNYTHNALVISDEARADVWPVLADWLARKAR